MKILTHVSLLIVLMLPFITNAQSPADTNQVVKFWDIGGKSGLTLTQTGQVNWVQGGEPSLSYLATVELFAKYNKAKHSWESLGKFAYGQQTQGYTKDFRISDDRIDLSTKYGYKVSKTMFLSVLGSFKSQFASGYEYPDDVPRVKVSEFLSPAYVTGALGFDYKPNENTSVFMSPISTKTTMVLDPLLDETKYGLDSAATVRNEIGAFVKATNKMQLIESVAMENSLELFSNYLKNPQNIDLLWDFKLIMTINSYLKTVLSTTMIYDDDISIPKDINDPTAGSTKAIQFKEMLSVGFLVSF